MKRKTIGWRVKDVWHGWYVQPLGDDNWTRREDPPEAMSKEDACSLRDMARADVSDFHATDIRLVRVVRVTR